MIGELQAAAQAVSIGIAALRAVQAGDKAINEAEWKLKLAEAMTALSEAKFALAGVAEETKALQDEIERLAAALVTKGDVVRYMDAYYKMDAAGKPVGTPYCMRCLEVDAKLLSVRRAARGEMKSSCPQCRAEYDRTRTPTFNADGSTDW